MTALVARSLILSTIGAADWLLLCQRVRDEPRWQQIFETLYASFQDETAPAVDTDDEAAGGTKSLEPLKTEKLKDVFNSFLTFPQDVYCIFRDAQEKGSLQVSGTTQCWTREGSAAEAVGVKINKSFADITKEAEEFLIFIFVFAQILDEESNQEEHVCRVLREFSSFRPTKALNDEDVEPLDSQFAGLLLRVLMRGFNMIRKTSVFRYAALIQVCEFAEKHNLQDMLLPYVTQFESWALAANVPLSPVQHRRLLTLVTNLLRHGGTSTESQLLSAVSKLVALDPETADPVLVVEWCVLALRHADTFDTLVESPALSALVVKQPEHKALVELVHLFSHGEAGDMRRFRAVHGEEFFQKYNLDSVVCEEKLLISVLASLAADARNLPLAVIAEKLEVSEEEAQRLAVRAISLGILDAQIDQSGGELIATFGLRRKFEQAEWELLDGRLAALSGNLSAMIAKLESV